MEVPQLKLSTLLTTIDAEERPLEAAMNDVDLNDGAEGESDDQVHGVEVDQDIPAAVEEANEDDDEEKKEEEELEEEEEEEKDHEVEDERTEAASVEEDGIEVICRATESSKAICFMKYSTINLKKKNKNLF